MPPNDPTRERYLNGDYAAKNPDWDSADASWKAEKVAQLLDDSTCKPTSLVEISCGSGAVLSSLRKKFPDVKMTGFDIAPHAQPFWAGYSTDDIQFILGDYLDIDGPIPDVVLVLDVLEHLGNPWEFLARLGSRCKLAVFHFPLDLSVVSVLREKPLLDVRDKVGHLHYFTRDLALALMEESGFEVIEARYTGAAFTAPQCGAKTRAVRALRRLAFSVLGHAGVRLLGGQTLLVLARPKGSA